MASKQSAKTIHAAIAVIERRGRYLICRRRLDDSLGGYWEFPGGKREPRESWEGCLRRELREELGIFVRDVRPYGRMRYRYPNGTVAFRIFRCAIAKGEPKPLDAMALQWISRDRLVKYRFPPANQPLVDRLLGRLRGSDRDGIIGSKRQHKKEGER